MKKIYLAVVSIVVLFAWCADAYADSPSIAVLRQGLLGAGAGAAATAMSGAKGDAVWRGALIGMGVNVVGGALLDVLTESDGSRTVTYVRQPQIPVQQVVIIRPAVRQRVYNSPQRRIYRAGYRNGYRQGYRDGYEDAVYDMTAY